VIARNTIPLTNTAPSICGQVAPIAARPKATNAFSPMYGATAIGRLAYRPMRSVPKTAARIVATVLGPDGIPANDRIAGFTTTMYAMVANVVAPPRTSIRTEVPRSLKRKSLSSIARLL
jgi:hypothetical protein